MPTTTFQGRKGTAIRSPRFKSFKLATAGFPFANGTGSHECIELGCREASELVLKPVTIKDATEREILQGYSLEGKASMLQTDLATIHDIYLASTEPCQALIAFPDGTFWNLTDPGSDLATPTGSTLVGVKWKYSLDGKSRKLEIDLDGYLYATTYAWLQDNDAAAVTGGTGGTSKGLAGVSYDRTKIQLANIGDVLVAGNSIGWFKDDFKFEVQASGPKLTPGMTACNMFDLKCEVSLQQTSKRDLKALGENLLMDADFEIHTTAGDILLIHSPGSSGEVHIDEKEPMAKLMLSGRWYKNGDEATPNNMDIGVTDAATWEFMSQWA